MKLISIGGFNTKKYVLIVDPLNFILETLKYENAIILLLDVE
ncbi:unnamed protein product [marine sediment metagenome]|uniref:Uncharacterized protein n=1 Tax=marine sediment metagenome TaxID=412755 RepID=X1HMV7_9ZZZZ